MKVIAMSDTHGQLDYINRLVKLHDADAVVHCGDFGFMTHDRLDSFPERELSLNIKHWPHLPDSIRKNAWNYSREEKIEIIREHQVLGTFDRYLNGEEEFEVPVYAVWGNHEDIEVVRKVLDAPPANLELVTSKGTELLDSGIQLFGIGGNISLKQFFKPKLSGNFYPYMTFQEWCEVKIRASKKRRTWMLTHVSPGKEPILELMSLHIRPTLWFSGHMGSPLPNQYNLFTFLDDNDLEERINPHSAFFIEEFRKWKIRSLKENNDRGGAGHPSQYLKSGRDLGDSEIISGEPHLKSRNGVEPFTEEEIKFISSFEWMLMLPSLKTTKIDSVKAYLSRKPSAKVKGTWFINLPDVYTLGYSVVEIENGNQKLVSYGHI